MSELSGIAILFNYDSLCENGLPPPSAGLLLNSLSTVLPFPPYFLSLYQLLAELKSLDWRISLVSIQYTSQVGYYFNDAN